MKDYKIAAVVVTYNRKQLLLENIEKLRDQTYKNLDIFIVDNHSTDGTYDVIKQYIDNESLYYYDTGDNLGGAGGFNYGVKLVANKKYDFVWLMDDDSMPLPNALEKLVDAYTEIGENIGFLSSKVLWTDGSLCKMNIQRKSLTKNIKDFSNRIIPASIASFVSLLIPMSVVQDVGLPIKDFFIWTDDWEYTRRISRKYPSFVIPESVVVHKTKTNNGANISTDSLDRIERYRYAYRNEMYLYKREGIKGILHVVARTPLHIYRILRYSNSKRAYRIKLLIESTVAGIVFNPAIEYVAKDNN